MFRRICRLVILLALCWPGASWGALSKAFLGSNVTGGVTEITSIAVTGLNTTGYTHLIVFVKHEGASTTITAADNKGSGAYNGLTIEDHTNGDLHSRLLWVKLGTPGTSTDVTVTFGAGRPYSRIAVWGVTSGTGELALDAQSNNEGTTTAIDAGSLVTTAATVSFMGVGEYSSRNYTAGSGWAEDLDNVIFCQSRADASGTLDPTATADGDMDWTANSASFKEAAGGAAVVPRMMLMGVGP